jgi:serine-type D-Ala-D-Ala carboxypeptidase (penicillin-binding protein 5/6)
MMENNELIKDESISKKLLALNAFLFIAVVFMTTVVTNVVASREIKKQEIAQAIRTSDAFKNVNIGAKSAYVFDVTQNKVIFNKNEFVQLPLASITKLMMALTASDIMPRDSKITIRKEFLEEEGDSGLLDGESWSLGELTDFSLVVSSNDGARSIASVIGAEELGTADYDLGRKEFITKMNLKAKELGLAQTYFVNESGLDVGATSGGYGSAIDISRLMQYILKNKPEILDVTKLKTVEINSLTKTHLAKNTNIDIGEIPGLIASKTGYTDLAGGNLAIAFDASIGRPIIVVVLGSTEKGRFEDVNSLVQASLEYVRE